MTKKEPKDKRSDAIILAALDEFLEKGYEQSSMEGIARRAGISKGGVYHHFQGKDEILLAANRKLGEPVAAMMQEAAQKATVARALSWYIRRYLEYWLEHQKEMVFFFLAMTKMLDAPELWKMYAAYTDGYIAFFQGLYERGIASGEFIPHPARENAVLLMAALDGILGYLIMDKDLDPEAMIAIYENRFVHAFRVQAQRQRQGGRR